MQQLPRNTSAYMQGSTRLVLDQNHPSVYRKNIESVNFSLGKDNESIAQSN